MGRAAAACPKPPRAQGPLATRSRGKEEGGPSSIFAKAALRLHARHFFVRMAFRGSFMCGHCWPQDVAVLAMECTAGCRPFVLLLFFVVSSDRHRPQRGPVSHV